MRLALHFSSWVVAASVGLGLNAGRAADATTTIDYTQRNTPFAPESSINPSKSTPQTNRSVQDARVEKQVREKAAAAIGDRRAAISVTEKTAKEVREKESHRPTAEKQQMSGFSRRPAAFSTAKDTHVPPTVAKYQDSLTAASATNMARFPAMDKDTKLTINRFVFRKNGADSPAVAADSNVVPAAGGSPVQR